MPYRRLAQLVLEEWDAAQARLVAAVRGSAEERAAADDMARLLAEYEALIERARELDLPTPPPFPRDVS